MTRFDEIQNQLRRVLDSGDSSLSRPIQFRRLTGNRAAEPKVYSDWEDSHGLTVGFKDNTVYDERRGSWSTINTGILRCPDDSPFPYLDQGDQIRFYATDGETYLYYAVQGPGSSGPGTVAYSCSNQGINLADFDRQGGV